MRTLLLSFAFIFFILSNTNSQDNSNIKKPVIKEYPVSKTNCISAGQMQQIESRVQVNIARLRAEGKFPAAYNKTAALKFIFPLKAAPNFHDSAFYAISNFVDHDITAGLLDWNCGARTYDGHTGTDISLWAFPWLMMNNKNVKVIAAADGTIVDKHDGEFDRNCYAPNVPANYVIVQHSNGYQTLYVHLKKGSVTTKPIGSTVTSGELLGYVGSSGPSTGPHLHFEVHDASNNVIDPYKGSCNGTVTKSLWKNQDPYWGHKLHKIMVTTTPTVYPYCPNPEQINEYPTIPQGYSAYFFAFLSEVQLGDTLYLKIIKPNAMVWQDYYYVFTGMDYPFAYTNWIFNMDLSQPKGTWTWQVKYNGKTFNYNFTVTNPVSKSFAEDNKAGNQLKGSASKEKLFVFPNPARNTLQVMINEKPGTYQLRLLDMAGRILLQKQAEMISGNNIVTIDVSHIMVGTYQLQAYNGETSLHSSIVIE